MRMLALLLCLLAAAPSFATKCEILMPKLMNGASDTAGTPMVGLIMIPGATIPGSAYLPLLLSIQEHYPGALWAAATEEWFNEFPNPIQIGSQIGDCISEAEKLGLGTDNVFMAGHSLGGVVLESYIDSNPTVTKGIALLGTWLPDLLGKSVRGNNDFPVPVLTAIGELDGGGLSYLRREVEETSVLPSSVQALTKTIMVPLVNHAQVASGEISEDVIDNDIDPEISNYEAHAMYGERVADWLAINAFQLGLMAEEEASAAEAHFRHYQEETILFMIPFLEAYEKEQKGSSSNFVREAQMKILDLDNPHEVYTMNQIMTNQVTFETARPSAEGGGGSLNIDTFSFMEYDSDTFDHNAHLSASNLKAKMMLADSVYPLLNKPPRGIILSCKELNQMSLDYALSIASLSALERMNAKGRILIYGEDEATGTGLGWEFSGGLQWEELDPEVVQLTSSIHVSDSDGHHYCDLLSPYRALEWIYIESVRHKMQF